MIDRPQSLCGDMVPMTAVLSHDVEFVSQTLGSSEEIIFVQTHTTNPLLRPGTIDAAVTAYRAAVPVPSTFPEAIAGLLPASVLIAVWAIAEPRLNNSAPAAST